MITDIGGRILVANGQAEKLFRYGRGALHGQDLETVFPNQLTSFREVVHESDHTSAENRLPAELEMQGRCEDGTEILIEASVSPIEIDALTYYILSIRDVTARNKAYSVQAYLASIVDSSDDAIIGTDLGGCILSWNPGAVKMFGYSKEEALGLNISLLIPPGHDEETEGLLSTLNREEMVRSFETERVRKDGELIPVSLNLSVLRNKKGEVTGVCRIARDLTYRKRDEDELRRLSQDLVQFAYAAAHDLQEPLRNIAVALDVLNERRKAGRETDAGEATLIEESIESANHMILMVRGLLAFARLSDSAEVAAEFVDVAQVLQQVLKTLRPEIEESGIEIRFSRLPRVRMERTHLEHLLQNLIANAIKYRKRDGHSWVSISATPGEGEWVFRFADNGIGFEPIYRERIFGIFKRLHTREEYAGTGIGLALCARIVGRYGGRIWAEGELGVGATFWFTIPAARVLDETAS